MSLRRNCVYSWQLRIQGLNTDLIKMKILHDNTSSNRKTNSACISVWTRGFDHPNGSLPKNVFEGRTSTWSEAFSLLICLDANKFVFLGFFLLWRRFTREFEPNHCPMMQKVHFRWWLPISSRLRQTANANLYHVTKFPLYFSFTVHYFYTWISSFTQFCIHKNRFEPFLSAHFLFWEILNLNLTFAFCLPSYVKLKISIPASSFTFRQSQIPNYRRLYPEYRFSLSILHPTPRLERIPLPKLGSGQIPNPVNKFCVFPHPVL